MLALEIIARAEGSSLVPAAQDETKATYSLWRDNFDYFIDWRQPAQVVLAHIRAVGFPYDGAKAVLGRSILTITAAQIGPDMNFAVRDPGKLWTIRDGRPLVVCGTGTLWIESARTSDGAPFEFKKVRSRFLTADTAWLAPYLR
jgi:methionyl-tRNA formyltransferase